MDVHPLYAAYTAAKEAKASADAAFETAKANLLAALPAEGIEVSTVETPHPVIKRVGGEVVEVLHPFLGTSIPEPA